MNERPNKAVFILIAVAALLRFDVLDRILPDGPPEAGGKLRVLIRYEQDDTGKMSQDQINVLTSQTLAEYLDGVTPTDEDGRHAWRRWEMDTNASNSLPVWQEWMAKKPESLPWIDIYRSQRNQFHGPLPPNVEETKKLIEKYK